MQANVMVMAKVGRSSSGIIVSCYYSILSSYSAILNPLYTNMSTWNINVECIFIFKAWIEDSFAISKSACLSSQTANIWNWLFSQNATWFCKVVILKFVLSSSFSSSQHATQQIFWYQIAAIFWKVNSPLLFDLDIFLCEKLKVCIV